MGYYKNDAINREPYEVLPENEQEHKGYIKVKPVKWITPKFVKNFVEFICGNKYDY